MVRWWVARVTSRHDDRTFADLARRKHAAHWAVKSPSNICRLGYILKALPHARVVMMVRDGRDTMLSLAERFPNEEATGPLVLGRWINDNTAGLLFSADPRVMVVRLGASWCVTVRSTTTPITPPAHGTCVGTVRLLCRCACQCRFRKSSL